MEEVESQQDIEIMWEIFLLKHVVDVAGNGNGNSKIVKVVDLQRGLQYNPNVKISCLRARLAELMQLGYVSRENNIPKQETGCASIDITGDGVAYLADFYKKLNKRCVGKLELLNKVGSKK